MKPPGDILLKRHEPVEPKLDRMWNETLAPNLSRHENLLLVVCWKLWRELIWPSRRIWAGLACAWAVIVILNIASSEPATRVTGKAEPMSPEKMQALIEQRRMLAQMIEPSPEPIDKRKSNPSGPRSDLAAKTFAV